MRRPNVYERSAPRSGRAAYREPATHQGETARAIAALIAPLIGKADASGLDTLSRLLDLAKLEAEKQAGS